MGDGVNVVDVKGEVMICKHCGKQMVIAHWEERKDDVIYHWECKECGYTLITTEGKE